MDDGKLAFVLNEETSATNDSFTFRVLDLNRNYVDNLRWVCALLQLSVEACTCGMWLDSLSGWRVGPNDDEVRGSTLSQPIIR